MSYEATSVLSTANLVLHDGHATTMCGSEVRFTTLSFECVTSSIVSADILLGSIAPFLTIAQITTAHMLTDGSAEPRTSMRADLVCPHTLCKMPQRA
jgi:hypothetical protein